MKVMKFGGSSVASADCIRQVARIVRDAHRQGPVAVVVSAFGGVTNDLLAAARAAADRDESYHEIWSRLLARHRDAVRDLELPEKEAAELALEERFEDLHDLLHGVFLLRESSLRATDSIVSYGERLSAEIVAAAFRAGGTEARFVDARRLVVTDDAFGNAQVDFEVTYPKIREELANEGLAVVTGFIAATPEGHTTTLGRGGSDYTAALVGAAVDASTIELWSDVDGVMSADPRLVPEAFPQPRLSYAELMELSHFGAEVVYPPSIHPARSRGIPLEIKNTFNPRAEGTRVTDDVPAGRHPIRGISAVREVSVMRLEGDGMVGVPGIAARLFGALAQHDVSVILISQSSSEHSICFAVAPEHAAAARRAVGREFALERQAGIVDELIVEDDQSVIAAVGEQMRDQPGLAGRVFSVLGGEGISVRAIAQGSSELNISLVISRSHLEAALTAIHRGFFAARRRRVALALLGPGRVGAELLAQIQAATPHLAENEQLDLRVVALANSRRMLLDREGIDLSSWREPLAEAEALDADRLSSFLKGKLDDEPLSADRSILVDCSASDQTLALYQPLLAAGVSVVAANKLPFVDSHESFSGLRQAATIGGSCVYHEASVGAGLPVIQTLADLVRSGDHIQRIDGVLSGTVNAVLERLAAGEAFSEAVRAAHQEGLTEPNPWEDLSGGDVARKLCILSRVAGHATELDEIDVEAVLPGTEWAAMDLETFWQRLPEVDEDFRRRQEEAAAQGARLRYVASLSESGGRVAIEAVPAGHPAHALNGADNLVAFKTARYDASPLVVRGPGAGTAVTAAGVFGDVLRAAERDRF